MCLIVSLYYSSAYIHPLFFVLYEIIRFLGKSIFIVFVQNLVWGGANSKKAAPELTGSIDNNKCHCFFYSVVQGINFGSRVLGTLYML